MTYCDPVIPLLGLYLKNPETLIQKNLFTPMFITALFTIAKCWKQPKCPSVDEWIKTLWFKKWRSRGGLSGRERGTMGGKVQGIRSRIGRHKIGGG